MCCRKVWKHATVCEQVPCTTYVKEMRLRKGSLHGLQEGAVHRRQEGALHGLPDGQGNLRQEGALHGLPMETQVCKKQCPYTVTRASAVPTWTVQLLAPRPRLVAPVAAAAVAMTAPPPAAPSRKVPISRDVCCTTCRMVQETCVKKVPYTVIRTVTAGVRQEGALHRLQDGSQVICKQVPYQVCKMVPYTVHQKVPYTVTECVPTQVCKQVKVCVPEEVCVRRCRKVPVTIVETAAHLPDGLLHPGLQELVLHLGFVLHQLVLPDDLVLHDWLLLHQLVLPDDLVLHDRLLLQQRLLQHQCLLHDLRRLLLQGELDQEALPSPPVL